MIAQSTAPAMAEAPVARSGPVAEIVTASAQVLRPARIVLSNSGEVELKGAEQMPKPQRDRDAAGTVWIEFS